MRLKRSIAGVGATLLAALLSSGSAVAQGAGPDRVPLIMTKLPPSGSAKYKAIISKAGKARGQVLTLTKTEMWEVPKENVEAVKKAAGRARRGCDPGRRRLQRDVPPRARRHAHEPQAERHDGDGEGLQVDHGGRHDGDADGADGGVRADQGRRPQHRRPRPPPRRRPRSGSSSATRPSSRSCAPTSTSGKDMCIWRGAVEGTGAPATIMWWPGGKMAGTVQHQGRIYSIRHMGGDMHGRGGDGRGQDAAGACADARAHARQRPQPARRPAASTRATPASCGR